MYLALLCLFVTVISAQPIDLDEITLHTYYSFVAYCDWNEIDYLLPNYDTITAYSDNDNALNFGLVLIERRTNHIIVALRGTIEEAVPNLVEDAYVLPRVQAWSAAQHVPSDVYVHPGFWYSWNLLKPEIIKGIEAAKTKYNATQITFTGHSLGGAIATIAAMDYYVSTRTVSRVITFGCPRVGNYYFAHYFEKVFGTNSLRFVNHFDFIPHLPLEDMGYYHTSVEHWFQNGTQSFRTCNFLGEDPACSDQLPFFQWNLNDHSLYPSLFSLTTDLKTCNGTAMGVHQALGKLEGYRRPDRLRKYLKDERRPL